MKSGFDKQPWQQNLHFSSSSYCLQLMAASSSSCFSLLLHRNLRFTSRLFNRNGSWLVAFKKAFYWQISQPNGNQTLARFRHLKYLGTAFNDDVTGFVCIIFPGWSDAIRPTQTHHLLLREKGIKLRVWHAGTILLLNTWITPLALLQTLCSATYPVTPKAGRALWSTAKWQKYPLLMTPPPRLLPPSF